MAVLKVALQEVVIQIADTVVWDTFSVTVFLAAMTERKQAKRHETIILGYIKPPDSRLLQLLCSWDFLRRDTENHAENRAILRCSRLRSDSSPPSHHKCIYSSHVRSNYVRLRLPIQSRGEEFSYSDWDDISKDNPATSTV
jgi:hypothetical protein